MSAWLVAALIAAWQLPDEPLDLFDCRIELLPDGPQWTPSLEGGGRLVFQPAAQNRAAPYTSVPPHVRFFAYHRAVAKVEADDESAAIEQATEKLRYLVGALGIVHSVPQAGPLFRIVSAAEIPPDTQPGQALPAIDQTKFTTALGGVIVNPLPDAARQQLIAMDRLARSDPAVEGIFHLWALAEEADRSVFSPQDLQDALLAYSRVAERIADAATPDPRPDVSKEIRAVGITLRDALNAELEKDEVHQSIKTLRQAIKAAQDQIAELRYQTSGLRLKRAAELLQASPELAAGIYAVWTMRSEKAGHDADVLPTTFEVAQARATIWEFLRLFCNWKFASSRKA